MVVLLFNLLQGMEQWLNQHIFKVGWLVTKNFQTTTILYYTFFLPGVILYEFTRWLVAGMLDVRAERAISFPEKQEIGELKLNFIRLHKKAPAWKVPIINYSPPVIGLIVIYIIAISILDVPGGLALMQSGTIEAIGAGIGYITARPDFTLWAYIMFTVSNSTIPNNLVIRGWRTLFITAVIAGFGLGALGIADNVLGTVIPPVLNTLNSLSGLFLVMMAINLLFTAVLAIIENSIEYVTGDSATFKNGKLVAMRRSEMQAMREQERQKTVKARQAAKQKSVLPSGPPSVYRLPLPVPGGPGEVPQVRIIAPEQPTLFSDKTASSTPVRIQPDLIPGVATGSTTRPESVPSDSTAVVSPPPDTIPGLVINPPRSAQAAASTQPALPASVPAEIQIKPPPPPDNDDEPDDDYEDDDEFEDEEEADR